MLETNSIKPIDLVLFVLAATIGLAIRLWLASLGHNYDMASWTIVSDIVVAGKNVYLSTTRYNYGPIWFIILGGLRRLHDAFGMDRLGPESFHIAVVAFLSLCDIAIAWLLLHSYGLGAAVFFLLNPVSLLLTGHHSQMDNLALLPGLIAWMLIDPDRRGESKNWIWSAALMGVSLSAKHILLFFPISLLAAPQILGSVQKRIFYNIIAFGTFALSLLPFVIAPGAMQAALKSFTVHLAGKTALFPNIVDLFFPAPAIDTLFGLVVGVSMLKFLFVVCVIATGLTIARTAPGKLFHLYLLAMLIFAPSMGDQYLAIPIITCAVYYRRWPAWVYVLIAGMLLETAAQGQRAAGYTRPWWHSYKMADIQHHHAVAWLIFLFISIAIGLRRFCREIGGHIRKLLIA